MVTGLLAAIAFQFFPLLKFMVVPIITLVHEIGHSLFAWIFGYPSIPTFDFNYGGGFSSQFERHPVVVGLIYLLFASALYKTRKKLRAFISVVVFVVLYSIIAFSRAEQVIVLFMGHGMELFFATLCFFRVFAGRALITEGERPIYAFIGFFILFHDISFSWGLLHDAELREIYEEGKGGGVVLNDFYRIATEYWNVDLSRVVYLFFGLCTLPPIVSFLFYKYEGTLIHALLNFYGSRLVNRAGPADGRVSSAIHHYEAEPVAPPEGPTYFIFVNGEKKGPFSRAELRDLLKSGEVNLDDSCWTEGMAEWKTLSSVIPSLKFSFKT